MTYFSRTISWRALFLLQNSMMDRWSSQTPIRSCAYSCVLSTWSEIGLSQIKMYIAWEGHRERVIQMKRTLVRKFRELAIFQMWNKTEGNKSMFFFVMYSVPLLRFQYFVYLLFLSVKLWACVISLLHILRINLHFYNRIFSWLFLLKLIHCYCWFCVVCMCVCVCYNFGHMRMPRKTRWTVGPEQFIPVNQKKNNNTGSNKQFNKRVFCARFCGSTEFSYSVFFYIIVGLLVVVSRSAYT